MFACLLPVTSFQGSCRNKSLVFPRQAAPCAAADPLAVMSALHLLLPATAVTVCSGIWCWNLLGTSSALLLKTVMLVLIHITWIPYSHGPLDVLMELQSPLERLLGGSVSALPQPQQEQPQLCWVIRCEGLHPHDLWAAPEELLSACRLSWAVTLMGTRGGCILSIL